MKIMPYFHILLMLFLGCTKKDDLPKIPDCIAQKIENIKKEDARNPPAIVYQYTFQKKTVYFFPQYCCDIPSELYDQNCTLICLPDGGITGEGDGKCPSFFQERTEEIVVWKDER